MYFGSLHGIYQFLLNSFLNLINLKKHITTIQPKKDKITLQKNLTVIMGSSMPSKLFALFMPLHDRISNAKEELKTLITEYQALLADIADDLAHYSELVDKIHSDNEKLKLTLEEKLREKHFLYDYKETLKLEQCTKNLQLTGLFYSNLRGYKALELAEDFLLGLKPEYTEITQKSKQLHEKIKDIREHHRQTLLIAQNMSDLRIIESKNSERRMRESL